MVKKSKVFEYEVYASASDLPTGDRELLEKAKESTALSYAPYSRFQVGAAALLANGAIVQGSNQENASYPAGLCAERALLAAASTLHSKVPVVTMAVSYHSLDGSNNKPISPCGICRQYLIEYESLTQHPIRLILGGLEGEVYIIEKASMLLPLRFTSEDMK